MIINHQHKFIFIHVPKTAGNSIRDVVPGEQSRSRGSHRRITTLRGMYSDYFSFGFVRNPWDRMCSLYHFVSQKPGFEDVKEMGFKKVLMDNLFPSGSNDAMWYLLGVQHIGRFEKLQVELNEIGEKLGFGSVVLKKKNASVHDHYRTYYDDEMIEFVADRHRSTIERFGYEF